MIAMSIGTPDLDRTCAWTTRVPSLDASAGALEAAMKSVEGATCANHRGRHPW
jgi:hypothetical protein